MSRRDFLACFGSRTTPTTTSATFPAKNGLPCATASTAATSNRALSLFRIHPRAPASSAPAINASESCIVRIRTSTEGNSRRIWRAASNPLSSGIVMSIMATSGKSRFAIATASRPVAASPQTVQSGCLSSTSRIPCLISGWSSARRIFNALIIAANAVSNLSYMDITLLCGCAESPPSCKQLPLLESRRLRSLRRHSDKCPKVLSTNK